MVRDDTSEEDAVLPVMEETATLGIRTRTTGRTRVTTRTETVTSDVEASLASSGVEVTRVTIGRDLAPDEAAPVSREEGDVTIVPVLEEILVVEKRLRLVEEVHIRRVTHTEDVRVPVTLRRQVADIEHEDVATDEIHPTNPEDQTNGL